jgi:DNA-directed RNA polymerase specialized sigma24 family protein
MGGTAVKGKAAFAAEEAGLAHAAAAGDGSAFAALYERYERRAYNVAFRLAGSEPEAADATQEAFLRLMRRPQDGELDLGPSLFMATRNACYDLMQKRRAAKPSVPESQEIREANMRLPEHQREALALRELEELSYDEIATIMETNRNSVAQLIFRARINLRDELHGTALATVAAPSGCERALRLIAAREDEQLEAGSDDAAWLDAHLAECERCRLAVEAMRGGGASYRAWAPIAVAPWLLEETMAKAAAQAGADWSEAIAAALASRADRQSPSGQPPSHLIGGDGEGWSARRRAALVTAGLAALLLGGGVAAVLAGHEPSSTAERPAADTHAAGRAPGSKSQEEKPGHRESPRRKASSMEAATQATTATSPPPEPQTEAGESGSSEPAAPAADHQGTSALQPPQAVATPKPKPKPDPPSQPAPAAAPTTEAQPPPSPPTEDPLPEHPSKGRGPPAGVPSRGGS